MPADRDARLQVGPGDRKLARFAEGLTECDFPCWYVRLYRGGNCACGDVDRLSPNRMADRSALLRIYFAIAHRLTITGRENLPAHGPFVLAANHGSHLDALALGATLTPHQSERAFPIAAGDVFFQTNVTSTFSAIMLNALPMWRKNCRPQALADLRRKLQEEKSLFIIVPEGAAATAQ